MTINIQYDRLPFNEAMTEFLIRTLNTIGEKYQWVTRAHVFFKKEEDPSGKGNICEIALSLPGGGIFASTSDMNFELAAKETTLEIEKQLKKRVRVLNAK